MAVEIVDIGLLPNDGTGSPLRVAFEKINNNFTQLAVTGPQGPTGAIQFKDNNRFWGDPNFLYDNATGTLTIGTTIVPADSANSSLGSAEAPFKSVFFDSSALAIGNVGVQETNNQVTFNVSGSNTTADFLINNITSNNINTSGSITTGGNVSVIGSSVVTTTTDTADQIVFEMPATEFQSGVIQLTSAQPVERYSQSVTLSITCLPSRVSCNYVAYGTTFVGNCVTRYDAYVQSGNVRVTVTPFMSATINHKISYQIIK